jgi:hypothetical protein
MRLKEAGAMRSGPYREPILFAFRPEPSPQQRAWSAKRPAFVAKFHRASNVELRRQKALDQGGMMDGAPVKRPGRPQFRYPPGQPQWVGKVPDTSSKAANAQLRMEIFRDQADMQEPFVDRAEAGARAFREKRGHDGGWSQNFRKPVPTKVRVRRPRDDPTVARGTVAGAARHSLLARAGPAAASARGARSGRDPVAGRRARPATAGARAGGVQHAARTGSPARHGPQRAWGARSGASSARPTTASASLGARRGSGTAPARSGRKKILVVPPPRSRRVVEDTGRPRFVAMPGFVPQRRPLGGWHAAAATGGANPRAEAKKRLASKRAVVTVEEKHVELINRHIK